MQLSVKVVGVEQARKRLAEAGRKVEPVLRGALNSTATNARKAIYVKGFQGTLKAAKVRSSLKIKRAGTRRLNARIIPSSSGILIYNYATWGFDPISATRARLWVRGPTGRKVAAGFINPSSAQKLPWNTRAKQGGTSRANQWKWRRIAMGPSSAYWFKQMTDAKAVRWVNAYLQQEFGLRMRKELLKGATP